MTTLADVPPAANRIDQGGRTLRSRMLISYPQRNDGYEVITGLAWHTTDVNTRPGS
jgi:hypothetical protein